MHDVIRDPGLPELLTVEIKSCRVDGFVVQEVDEDPFAVAGRCGGSHRCFFVELLRRDAGVDVGFPELPATASVVADDGLNMGVDIGRGQKDSISDHNRRTVSASRNGGFPDNILFFVS